MEAPTPHSEHSDAVPAARGSSEPVATESPAALVPRTYGAGWRALFAVVGVAMLFAAGVLALSGGWMDVVLAVLTACFGGTMGYFAVTGREPASSRLYTPSERFAELADPARPLTADDLRLPPAESTLADPPGGAAEPDDPSTMLERWP
jgi:hypothetical protein